MSTTRAEHHADSPEPEVRTAKDTIGWVLTYRTSRATAISSRGLAEATGYPNSGIAPTTVRDAIRALRRHRNLPIVSCSNGYSLIDDPDGVARELDRIRDEIETRRETMQELTAAYNHHTGTVDR